MTSWGLSALRGQNWASWTSVLESLRTVPHISPNQSDWAFLLGPAPVFSLSVILCNISKTSDTISVRVLICFLVFVSIYIHKKKDCFKTYLIPCGIWWISITIIYKFILKKMQVSICQHLKAINSEKNREALKVHWKVLDLESFLDGQSGKIFC